MLVERMPCDLGGGGGGDGWRSGWDIAEND